MKRVKLTKKEIDAVFEAAEHQSDYVVGLYKTVLEKAGVDLDAISSMNHFPVADPELGRYIMQKAMEFDRKHHPNVMNGGCWMNNGFGTTNHGLQGTGLVEIDVDAIT